VKHLLKNLNDMKIKVISNTLAWIIQASLNFVENRFIGRIPNSDVRAGAKLLLDPIRKMVKALSDEEPRNEEQIRDLWRQFINTDFTDYSAAQLDKLVSGIGNEQLKAVLATLIAPAMDLTRAVTDDNPANDEQAKEILDKFIENPDAHDVLLSDILAPVLRRVINDEPTVAFILTIIGQALENLGEGESSLDAERRAEIVKKISAEVASLES
jgi:hypothetical protein